MLGLLILFIIIKIYNANKIVHKTKREEEEISLIVKRALVTWEDSEKALRSVTRPYDEPLPGNYKRELVRNR
jgi:hypothetical protein